MAEGVPALADADAEVLQGRLVAFVRAFGLHKGDETPCGVSVSVSEAHALTVLVGAGPEGLVQGELARRLALTKSTVSRLVDQLVDSRWAARQASPGDARRRTVVLTEQGQTVAGQILARRAERMARLLERIPEHERTAVLAALDILVEAARDDV